MHPEPNMATAWADKGRLIVKKPNQKAYAIELAGVADAERVQIQLVKFEQDNSELNSIGDSDMEKTWCSEFTKLRDVLKREGNYLEIEKAIPIGVKPLKIVSNEDGTNTNRQNRMPASEERTIT